MIRSAVYINHSFDFHYAPCSDSWNCSWLYPVIYKGVLFTALRCFYFSLHSDHLHWQEWCKHICLNPFFPGEKEHLFIFFPPTFIQGVLSLYCSVFLFCSPIVMLLFILNLPLFWTTNHCLALFVFGTTDCLFLIQALSPLATLSSLAHCLCLRLPLVIYGTQNCRSTEK